MLSDDSIRLSRLVVNLPYIAAGTLKAGALLRALANPVRDWSKVAVGALLEPVDKTSDAFTKGIWGLELKIVPELLSLFALEANGSRFSGLWSCASISEAFGFEILGLISQAADAVIEDSWFLVNPSMPAGLIAHLFGRFMWESKKGRIEAGLILSG